LQIRNRALYRRKYLESFALLVRKVTKQSRKGVGIEKTDKRLTVKPGRVRPF
jgi:hypothetical protein